MFPSSGQFQSLIPGRDEAKTGQIHYTDYMSASCKDSTAWVALVQTSVLAVANVEPGGCWPLFLCLPWGTGDHLSTCSPGERAVSSSTTPEQKGHLHCPLLLAWATEADVGLSPSWELLWLNCQNTTAKYLQCVSGLASVSWYPHTGCPTLLSFKDRPGEVSALLRGLLSLLLCFLDIQLI